MAGPMQRLGNRGPYGCWAADEAAEALPVEGWLARVLAPLHAKLNDHHEGAL